MYCPPNLHKNDTPHLTLDQMKQYWNSIYEKTKHTNLAYKISITGGEPTGNRDLTKFLEWARTEYKDKIAMVVLSSNGSASVAHYKQLFSVVDNITFSIHSEHINEVRFFNKVKELSQFVKENNRVLHVEIMDEFWNRDRIPAYRALLDESAIPYSVNTINLGKGTRAHPIFKGRLNLDIP